MRHYHRHHAVRVRDDVFAALAALHGSERLDAKDTSPLLPDSRQTAYTTRGLYKLVVESAQSAELDKPVSPHWLHHSHATLAALGGASAFAIRASLGHSRLETSQRYAHTGHAGSKTPPPTRCRRSADLISPEA
jgi:site-specific recombinase XerD